MSEERGGGRLTFFCFFVAGIIWLISAAVTAGEAGVINTGGWGLVGFMATGAIVGGLIGCYNLGREKGR